jgi:hypothetical protein
MPPLHALWMKGLLGGTIDAPGHCASRAGIDAMRLESCENLTIRESRP